jgi:nicotinamidase-related amidase
MKALLVVDIQKGLTLKRKVYNEDILIETVNNAIDNYRESGDMVIFVQHNNKFLKTGEKDWEIDERIHWFKSDPVIQKYHGDAFKKTNLDETLKKYRIKEITVCGLTSHGCVKATCLGALEHGYLVKLIKEGHSNVNKNAKEKILQAEKDLEEKGIGYFYV